MIGALRTGPGRGGYCANRLIAVLGWGTKNLCTMSGLTAL